MRKICAHYLFTGEGILPIKRGVVTLNSEGEVVEIGVMEREEESTEFYDGILVPGFVNSHTHLELSHLKGRFEKGSGMAGFIRQINALRQSSSREERVAAVERELEQLYKSGLSALADISNGTDSFVPKSNSPIYSRTFLELFGTEPEEVEGAMERVALLQEEAHSMGLDSAPTPHSCYTMSPQLLERVSQEGLKSGFLSYHNQESWEEELLIEEGSGPLADEYNGRGLSTPPITGSPSLHYFIERLESGATLDEQHILLVHNTFTNRESVERAKEKIKKSFWALCPLSNLFIHKALPPIMMMRQKGLTLTLGTDSLSSNEQLSMVEEIKALHRYFPSLPLEEIIRWATLNGALFLKKEGQLGSIEIGKKPGIVLIDKIDWREMKLSEESSSVRLI